MGSITLLHIFALYIIRLFDLFNLFYLPLHADHREIAKKWENLRRSYRRHCNVKKTSYKSGSAASDDYLDDPDEDEDGIGTK